MLCMLDSHSVTLCQTGTLKMETASPSETSVTTSWHGVMLSSTGLW